MIGSLVFFPRNWGILVEIRCLWHDYLHSMFDAIDMAWSHDIHDDAVGFEGLVLFSMHEHIVGFDSMDEWELLQLAIEEIRNGFADLFDAWWGKEDSIK